MSALIDIVITFIAAMVSAAFVHFGAHSEKPRSAPPPPTEQSRQAYEPARFETVSDEAVEPEAPPANEAEAPPAPPAPPAPVDVRIDAEHAAIEARVEADHMAREHDRIQAQSQRIKAREMRKWQDRERARVNAH